MDVLRSGIRLGQEKYAEGQHRVIMQPRESPRTALGNAV